MNCAPCIVCQSKTNFTAEIEHDLGTSLVPMCPRCVGLGKMFQHGEAPSPRRQWWPRIGMVGASAIGLQDANDPTIEDFEGRTLVIEWGRFAVEIFMGRK